MLMNEMSRAVSGVEGSLPFTVVANIYRCRPTIGRELLSATCAVNCCLIGDKRRVLTKQGQLLVGQSVALDLAISAGVTPLSLMPYRACQTNPTRQTYRKET